MAVGPLRGRGGHGQSFLRSALAGFFFLWFVAIFYFVYARKGSPGESQDKMIARIKREFDAMRVDYCADWKDKKGIDCPESIPSSDSHLMLLHGHLKCHFGDTPSAIISTERAVAMDAGYVEAHYQLFKIQSGIGDFASARAHLQEVLRKKPKHFEAMISLQYLDHQLVQAGTASKTDGLDHRVCSWLRSHTAKLGYPATTGWGRQQDGEMCNFFSNDVWRPRPWQLPEDEHVPLKEQFWRDQYLIVKSVLPESLLDYFQMLYRVLIDDFEHSSDDTPDQSDVHALMVEADPNFITSNRRYEFSTAEVANFVNMQLTPWVEKLVGQKVFPIYAFPVVYIEGGGIEPHRDVSENEISLSMQVSLTHTNGSWTWPLTVERPHDYHQEAAQLNNNEGVLYHGTEVLHWRDSYPPAAKDRPLNIPEQYRLVQIVFAWRRVNPSQCVSQ